MQKLTYAKHPHDVHPSLEIKKIDDEIVECTQKMEQESGRAGQNEVPLEPSIFGRPRA
jgi:hypothetical protein